MLHCLTEFKKRNQKIFVLVCRNIGKPWLKKKKRTVGLQILTLLKTASPEVSLYLKFSKLFVIL